uniref:Chromo domain-containing protein n=1 Tax=Neogobius melanostomus TaxID=47308 RepID=A0A8C6UCR7_9GOBI
MESRSLNPFWKKKTQPQSEASKLVPSPQSTSFQNKLTWASAYPAPQRPPAASATSAAMADDTERVEPGESEEEDVYEVERIIDMRVEEGEVLYRVRWKNYCSDDDTWEPEAHLEDCREVLLTYKKNMAEAKAKKESESKKKVLPAKSDLFAADSDSDSDKDRPTDLPVKKKKKKVEEPPPTEKKKKKKKKDRRLEDFRPLPAPETDEEELPTSPPATPKIRALESDEEPVPTKKLKKEKAKEVIKQKPKAEEAKKKRGKKELKIDTSDDDTAPIEEDISEGPSETPTEDTSTEPLRNLSIYLDDKFKEKKGKWEVKLQGFKDLIQKKESKNASPKESSLQKLKSLTSKAKEEAAPHSSDSSDSSTAHRKPKSKDRGTVSSVKAKEDKAKEDKVKEDKAREDKVKEDKAREDKAREEKVKEDKAREDTVGQKDAGSTNLFEKFLLNCEAKDRAPRRPATHQLPPEKSSSKPLKLIGKIEKIPKSKESPVQRAEPERTDKVKLTEAPAVSKAGQSHGFSLDSDEREGEEFSSKSRFGDEGQRSGWDRRERPEEGQRSSWDRHSSMGRRRDDSEPRLFMACEDSLESQDLLEHTDKTEKATLNLGMDLNLDWMTLEDFQKHLNGDDEVLSGPPLSPSELRDAVKSGDYLAVKLALNSKEDYNLDQEDCTGGLKKCVADERHPADILGASLTLVDERIKRSAANVTTRSKTQQSFTANTFETLSKQRLRSTNNNKVKVKNPEQSPAKKKVNSNVGIVKQNQLKRNQTALDPPRTGLCTRTNDASRVQNVETHEPLCDASSDNLKNSRALCPASPLLPKSEFLTGGCEDLIHVMHQDNISRHILNDPVICKYGQALSVQHNHDKSHFPSIAQKMRQLGRLVVAASEMDDSVQCLKDLFLPTKFELTVKGAKKAFGFDTSSSTNTALITKIGFSLKGAAEIARTMDGASESEINPFIKVLDTKWDKLFSQSSHENEELQQVDISTVTADLLRLHKFISQEQEDARKDLQHSPTLSTWKKLSEATLADVCLFNRIRVGNIGRLLLETYSSMKSTGNFIPSADQIRKSTKLELEMSEQLTRLELEGQFGRSLLVLLTQRMVSLIDSLIEHRNKVGVSQNNVYLFARIEGPSFVRGLDCLRRAAVECGVVNTEALFCPSLRQQIASSWQLLSICQSELGQVSKMLGRSVQECSQFSQNATVLEEFSKQLLQMNPGLPSSTTGSPKQGVRPKSAVKRRPWSEQEQAAVKRFLSEFITKMKVPGKKECNACLVAEPDLCRRSWTDIKNFVHNTLQTLRRRQNQPEKPKPEKTVVNPKRKKTVTQSTRKHCDVKNTDSNLMANLEDTLTAPSHVEQSMVFPLDLPSGYDSFGSANSDMVYANPTCSFSSPNVFDTQVVPTYTQLGTVNAVIHPLYSPESKFLPPMSPSNPQHPSSIPLPLDYVSHDAESSPVFASLNSPTASVSPTYTTLSTAIFPPYSAVNDRS